MQSALAVEGAGGGAGAALAETDALAEAVVDGVGGVAEPTDGSAEGVAAP